MPAGDDDRRGTVRAAFGGLTTRGRSFVAAGAAASVCAYLLGQPDLLRVGALLVALPVVSVLVLYLTRSRVTAARRLSPARVPAGGESRVHLRVDNAFRLPSGQLMLQDRVPYVLGPRPRFVLDRIEPGGQREVSYRVRSDQRGRYPLGPLELRLADPFGMVELHRSFDAYDVMTVLPHIETLPPVRLGGEAGGQGESGQRSLAVTGEEDVIPRDYRHGDDLRRVHWRSTAHRGQLMVRREEQPPRARCTVLLDTRRSGYAGTGPQAPFERAVSGAASVISHLAERGYQVRLITDRGLSLPGPGHGADSVETTGLMLDALAVLDHSALPGPLDLVTDTHRVTAPDSGLDGALSALAGADCGLLIAFLGAPDLAALDQLARLRQRAADGIAFVAAGQLDPGVEAGTLGRLRESGWAALPLHPGVPLAQVWQQAGGERAASYRGR
ncbi:DUF58 domain-containing protein [Streptomyces carpaticus]|uniref:DUF58 domain-containing protein n=1 Tax=Streptomyces cheonanensis TaxID=312720 RepID=A0ABN2UUK8_9ACTN|nr:MULTISPECIES: DUF58 domain-containing protein [Streptomyces]QKV68367.1 DUF58 domain-containing protein [Streptomyces harbinensis]UWM48690.1 DUF58 domain-containing protein [Streptomyces carpaticus]